MSLHSKIETKLSEALKAQDKKTYSTLRLIIAAIKDLMIAKKIKDKNTLPDNDLVALLKKMVKQRNDSCEAYKKAGRKELLDNEKSEIAIINEFLPKQLSEEQMNKICVEKIKQVGASSIKDMGKVIGALKKDYSDAKIIVTMYNRVGDIHWQRTFHDCFVNGDIPELALDYASGDPLEMEVTFRSDYFTEQQV